jgi:hypothetical protein
VKILRLSRGYQEAADKLIGQFADPSNAELTIDADTTLLADGAVRAVFLRNAIPSNLHKLAFEFWKSVDEPLTNRPAATGTKSRHRSVGRDGSLSRRRGVNAHVEKVLKEQGAAQGVLGWDARNGGLTPLTIKHRELLDGNGQLIELVDSLYARHVPSLYAIQRVEVQKNPDSLCPLGLTAFSNIYILKQWATAYHKDDNNLPGVLTAIMACGTFIGGALVLPRWQISIPYQPGDLILFDPQQVHGNLPFKGRRISAAFYCSRHIADSGSCRAV